MSDTQHAAYPYAVGTPTATAPLDEPRTTPVRGRAFPWPDLVIGLVAVLVGWWFARTHSLDGEPGFRILLATVFVAAASARRLPSLALAAVWLMLGEHLTWSIPFGEVDFVALWVAFGTARWGRLPTVWLSALSVPVSMALLAGWTRVQFRSGDISSTLKQLLARLTATTGNDPTTVSGVLALLFVGTLLLVLPWLVGMLARNVESTRRLRALRERAEHAAALARKAAHQTAEIAALREVQARLAHDVHDVVGHSLTVVLSQAEAGQYLEDPAQVRATLANIATAARSSLQEVRGVLGGPQVVEGGDGATPFSDLLDTVRRGGLDVRETVHGTPQPLPPELATVARRVTQELLTNALRHGDRSAPISVVQQWGADIVRVEVANTVAPDLGPGRERGAGTGLVGIRRRLESVGGRFAVQEGEHAWRASAWLPVRAGRR